MQLGFIGTGEITASIVTGLRSFAATPDTIQLSPRNPAIANNLANRFEGISIASCNQEVLDGSDIIVIAVRPQAARSVLSELRFRADHQVIRLRRDGRDQISPKLCPWITSQGLMNWSSIPRNRGA